MRSLLARLFVILAACLACAPAWADKRVALRTDQRDWIRQRDPHCKAQARPSEGASSWPLVFYKCLEKASADRLEAINGWEGRK